jgi:hypothetical protein
MEFFRVFIEPARIRLAGRLLEGAKTLGELTAESGMDSRTVARHLARFGECGLLIETGDGGGRLYALDEARLRSMAEATLTGNHAPLPADERAKTVRTFLPEGRLAQMPSQQRKQLYVLAEVVKHFEPGATYFERDVNAVLKAVSSDQFVTLRRMLVDFGFLKRDNALGGAVYTRGLSTRAIFEIHGIPWLDDGDYGAEMPH